MATIERALRIAADAHEGQTDKSGEPYILHPLRAMARVDGRDAQIVAILHDVVEDTSVTFEDLRAAGFGETVLSALRLVTHRKEEPYVEYVVRCKANPIARQVKLADLHDNSRPDRAILRAEQFERDRARMLRYAASYKFLSDRISEDEYRKLMAVLV